jgi:Tfp pilus assembly ATPase PilU
MQDGALDGMQHFDAEIERMIREGVVEFETGMSYATNAGNLRLQLADYLEETKGGARTKRQETEIEIER